MLMTIMDEFDISDGAENFPIRIVKESPRENLKQYVCCNIPGPGTDTSNFEEKIQGCTCSGASCDISPSMPCTCMGYGPTYNADGKLLSAGEDTARTVFLECNSLCNCPMSCYNRVVQKGIQKRLQVFYSEEKGFGLKTVDFIECGAFVCEYAGEILNEKEAKDRARIKMKNGMNYIFVLREHVTSGVIVTYIDPSNIGNVGRFINHSCEPNLCIRPVRVHNLVPKVCLFASQDIDMGEELTYSYGYSEGCEGTNVDVNRKICLCGSKNCTGLLPCDRFVLSS